ncbi:hypothetical protein LCGC14_1062900 [marine sediment metagenome]|uniref:Uncharacterized protein n=1 Tax=marine sediment metagenome TaxID=412755 RepID=A0A0F9N7J9_9ZZZZ
MNYTKLCGCKIHVDDTAIEIMELEYCPKHSACDDMYKACKGVLDWWQRNYGGFLPDEIASVLKAVDKADKQ